MTLRRLLAWSLVFSTIACGGGSSGDDTPDPDGMGGGVPDGGGTRIDSAPGSTRLIESSFTLAPGGDEKWQCERKTLTQDVWIATFTPIAPPGTHHTLLAIDNQPEADGTTACDVSLQSDWTVLFASGLGSPPLHMPAGVAVHLSAGQQIVLDLHLYNFSDAAIAETSGIDILTADPTSVHDEAEVILAGPLNFEFSGMGEHIVRTHCTTPADTSFFAVFPHMHQLGTHAKVELRIGGATQTIHDEPYDFEQQWFREVEPIAMHAGDTIETTCTYYLPDDRTVRFGESSDAEMCFAISYRFPPVGATFGNLCFD